MPRGHSANRSTSRAATVYLLASSLSPLRETDAMNTQFSSKAALSVAIIGGWMVLTAQSCGDSTGPTVVIQECDVTLDSDFPTDGNFYLNKPANCPILLAGMTTIPYAATADFPSWAITYGFYEGSVVTWDGYLVTLVANPVWN